MADKDDEKDTTEEETDETEEETEDESTDDSDDSTEDDGKPKPGSELAKAIARRDRALARARKAEKELADSKKDKDDDKPDPIAVANSRVVNASARALLASTGITDREDQKAVIAMIRLDDIEVDDEGPDEDAIEERISDLRRIFGAKTSTTTRVPRTTSTRDKGGAQGGTTSDPDKARYQRFMSGKS
jgi:hypothetical protein